MANDAESRLVNPLHGKKQCFWKKAVCSKCLSLFVRTGELLQRWSEIFLSSIICRLVRGGFNRFRRQRGRDGEDGDEEEEDGESCEQGEAGGGRGRQRER